MAGITQFLGKDFTLYSSDNFDEYMKAIGVKEEMRKMGVNATMTVNLTEKDGVYTFRVTTPFRMADTVFKIGEEFDETTRDGRKVKNVINIEGNVMTHTTKGEGPDTKTVRTFSGNEFVAVLSAAGVTCTRKFKCQ